jgi:hypothetical protein
MHLLGLSLWQGKQYNTKDVRFSQSSLCHAFFFLSAQRILVVTKYSSFSMRREKL